MTEEQRGIPPDDPKRSLVTRKVDSPLHLGRGLQADQSSAPVDLRADWFLFSRFHSESNDECEVPCYEDERR